MSTRILILWPGAFLLAFAFFLQTSIGSAQSSHSADSSTVNLPPITINPESNSPLRNYRAASPRINDLVDTRLDVHFDFPKRWLYGKEWVTLQPHWYPTDSLLLDAKGMDIHELELVKGNLKTPLKYDYDGSQLRIGLGRTFTRHEKYTLYIDYTSKPDELKNTQGSAAITSDKGLYFINPDGKDPFKPTEVWTQGETQANSVWFPTIDRPDQKTLEQISMTVQDGFVTLSNGRLISTRKNPGGTHTDTWKMDHPNSPYLFMMAAGPFVIVKDHWKQIPLDYYVEKAYAPYAKDIFGHTPAMIDFYSKILGVPYQWSKYDQVVVRDYVSGAMENTTATLHGEFMYKTRRQELDDDYANESVYAHELFHHWFGDLVTCESWSNLTLNESFADFSEMLWAEHEYGRDLADQHSFNAMQEYFRFASGGNDHPLVDYHYKDREDVFDPVTYQKGGRVLNMLRHVVGDSAFFGSLHYYLEQNKFHPAQVSQLREAFEHITGKDLHWFFNQWYFRAGYPKLDISYLYPQGSHEVEVVVSQKQEGQVFELPFAIDLYVQGKPERHWVTMMDKVDTFRFSCASRPDLVNVDAEKCLLAEKTDHKTLANFVYQFYHAPLFLDRREAIEACAKVQSTDPSALKVLIDALHDPFYGLRTFSEQGLRMSDSTVRSLATPILQSLVSRDPNSGVRAEALSILEGGTPYDTYSGLIGAALKDSSYKVESAALTGLVRQDSAAALSQARAMETEAYPPLSETICALLARYGTGADFPYVQKNFEQYGSFSKFSFIYPFLAMLTRKVTDPILVDRSIDQVSQFGKELGSQYGVYVVTMLRNFANQKKSAAASATDPSVRSDINAEAAYGTEAAKTLEQSFNNK